MGGATGSFELDAASIVGLLADDDRRRCFAALELGATTRDAVAVATSLSTAAAAKALGRLIAGGLVVAGDDGGLHVIDAAFQQAARAALHRTESDEHDGQPADVRKVLRNFVTDGRITQIPTNATKRRVLLDWLAQEFEPGRRYSEAMVNLILGQRHPDTAALRRSLVDEGLLDRADGQYWRSGGPALP
ncbi:MAG: uncharacterized protein JWL72_39 [Ilumatobacteraceae bacterium]|nr:uncharacterized protein [Ilumatobacteraceae bacterium]